MTSQPSGSSPRGVANLMFTGRGIAFGATGSNTIVGTLLALDLDELELGRTAQPLARLKALESS